MKVILFIFIRILYILLKYLNDKTEEEKRIIRIMNIDINLDVNWPFK